MNRPLLVTMGDPTGIGPEIIVKAWRDGAFDRLSRPLTVVGDVGVLLRAAAVYGTAPAVKPAADGAMNLCGGERQLTVQPLSTLAAAALTYGAADAACGQAMLAYIEWACARCLDGSAAGMVTAPISKSAIHAAGCAFPGHTELLAERCGVAKVVMMLAGERLKVALVTTHLALRDVAKVLTAAEILATIRITAAALRRDFGLAAPRLAVLALNPHAGEDGLFGDEEVRLIAPAIAKAQAAGIAASGPHSADTLFHFAVAGNCDAVVCMYHDQGLIPLKLLHFDDGVNVTLGLPIVRTSVDHGTAYDLAGTGRASAASLIAAVRLAEKMAGPG
ncbi:MAG: 4-hydroxythreonine-4-phosphate dehydrogenase PdxA [Desulfuromonadales bacterium GWD2_61_12]|nr:MAG: 4-hydroxythreonine-4-phosphate dehydrogenase PdxA [Desulfuromonadales bacterium GWD2_61_12]